MKYNYYYFNIQGQIPSGKNAIIVTRKGFRIPGKVFTKWKKEKAPFLKIQRDQQGIKAPLYKPVDIIIKYTAADKRRRDATGMMDAIWHILEYCEIISDDTFLGGREKVVVFQNVGVDKIKAGVKILIREEA